MLKIVGLSVLASSGLLMAAGQAEAKGCNGVVNQFEWGCAAWDNNNGPQYPHYKAPPKAAPPAPAHQAGPPALIAPPKTAQPAHPPVAQQPVQNTHPNGGNGVIAAGGGNGPASGVIAAGGGNGPASGLLSPGNKTGSTLISPGNRNGN